MADLRDIFTATGCAAAQTYIQSGNVVFEAAQDFAKRVPEIVTRAILRRFGYETAVIVRSSEELREVVASNPFDTSGDPRFLHVAFLDDTPGAEAYSVSTLSVPLRTRLSCECKGRSNNGPVRRG